MSHHTFTSNDSDTLVFRRPREDQIGGIVGAVLSAGLLCVFYAMFFVLAPAHHTSLLYPGPTHRLNLFFPVMIVTLFLGYGAALWHMLYLSSSFLLRFDLRRGTYEIRDGCFPWRRTESGMTTEIEAIYANKRSQGDNGTYVVSLQWKPSGRKQRRSSTLALGRDRHDAEAKAEMYARKLGVPYGDTRLFGRRVI